jgi:hypothetical protein
LVVTEADVSLDPSEIAEPEEAALLERAVEGKTKVRLKDAGRTAVANHSPCKTTPFILTLSPFPARIVFKHHTSYITHSRAR